MILTKFQDGTLSDDDMRHLEVGPTMLMPCIANAGRTRSFGRKHRSV